MKRAAWWMIASGVALSGVLAACGGRTAGTGASGDHSDAGGSSAEAGGSSSGAGSSSSGGTTSIEAGTAQHDAGVTPSDAGICVDIDPATFDTSCGADTDCINVATGTICAGYNCLCGGTAISASEQSAYDAQLAEVPEGSGPFCGCPYLGNPRCIQSQCVYCPAPYLNQPEPPGCGDGG